MCEYITSIVETLTNKEETIRKLRKLFDDLKIHRPSDAYKRFDDYCDRIRRLADSPIDYDTWRFYEYIDTYGTDYAITVETLLETPKETTVEYTNNRSWLVDNGLIPDNYDQSDSNVYWRGILRNGVLKMFIGTMQVVYIEDTCQVVSYREDGTHDGVTFIGDSIIVLLHNPQKVVALSGGKLTITDRLTCRSQNLQCPPAGTDA